MKLIDTNALIVLILGLIDPRLINTHKRTSIYQEQDYHNLISLIGDINNLVTLPNVWTEVDNLLNNTLNGKYQEGYIIQITNTIKKSTEKFIESNKATESKGFINLGLTDSLLLEFAKECEFIITGDSKLSDFARAHGIQVFDLVKNRNERL